MGKLGPELGLKRRPVSRARVFPGGAIANFDQFVAQARATWPFLGDDRSLRLAHAYGTMLGEMLDGVTDEAGMGADLGGGLTEIEARWMRDREWARTAEDALMRRSKIGLHLSDKQRSAFEKAWNALT